MASNLISINKENNTNMKRILHWGPILGLSMTNFVISTNIYYLFQWQYPLYDLCSFLNYTIYICLAIFSLYHYFSAVIVGPGFIPLKWKPKKKQDEQFMQYCYKCKGYKAPRSHHCSKCDRCVMKMDHHCPWINNCVGHANHRHFIYFLLYSVIGSFQTFITLGMTLYRAIFDIPNVNHRYIFLSFKGFLCIVISIGLCLGVIIGVGALLILQLKIALKNQTSIEDWIVSKANKRDRKDVFKYPYHLGYWNNMKMLFLNEIGNGFHWQVAEGCDQYSLTFEQLEQKRVKRENSQHCRVVESYNGRYFPLFSKGFRTCISYPFNFDSRLPLEEGEDVLVTNWHKKWLYGHRMNDPPSKRKKGWFPHSCVVLLVEPQNFSEDKKKYQ